MSVNVGTAIGYFDLDASKFKAGLKDAQSTLSEFTNQSNSAGTRFEALGSSLKTVGSNMSKYVTLPLAGIGAASVATAANFEKSMSQVAATMGITAEEINNGSESYKKLEKAALDMGATTQFSASEASEALNYLALAGYDAEKSVETLPTVLNLAAAGGLELGYASDVMTDAMSALGLETSQAANFVDQLAKTSQKSNTSVGQLGEAILTVGGTAKVLAGGTTEMNTALGILADNGIKGAEGGTALRNVILSLSAPTDKAAKTMNKLGLEVFDAQGNMRPLNEIFKDLDGTLSTMTQGEQTKVLSELFNKVDLKSVNALLANSGERFDELSGYIANADGAAADMADTMNNNLSGQLTLLKSGLEGAAISIGNALMPMIKVLVEWINNLVNWFNNLSPGIQTAITMFGLVVASIGPVLLIVGHLCIAIGGLITFFGAGGAGAGILSAAIGALSGPIGIAIGVITALIAAGVLLYNNWDTIKTKCSEVWNSIVETVTTVWNTIKTSTLEIWNNITSTLSSAWDTIKTVTQPAVDFVKDIVSSTWNFISTTTSTIWNSIKGIIQSVWELIKSIIDLGVAVVKLAITAGWNAIKTVTTTVWNAIKSVIQTVWNAIKPIVTTGANAVKSVVTTVFNVVKSFVTTIWNSIKTVIQTAWNGIKSVVSTGANLVRSTISSVFSTLTNIMTAPFKAAQSVISGILGGITSAINSVTSGIKKVTSMFRMVEDPRQEEQEYLAACNDNDYTKARFNYARAKQTTVSDVIAANESMSSTISKITNDVKTKSAKESSFNYDKFIDKINSIKKEIVVPVNIDGREFARVIAEYTDVENGQRISFSERGLVL